MTLNKITHEARHTIVFEIKLDLVDVFLCFPELIFGWKTLLQSGNPTISETHRLTKDTKSNSISEVDPTAHVQCS